MSRSLKQIQARKGAIQKELQKLRDESDNLDDAKRADFESWTDTLMEEFDELVEEEKPLLERMARLGQVLDASKDEAKVEETDVPKTPDLLVRTKRNPFDGVSSDALRSGTIRPREVRERALDAIERADKLGQFQGRHDFAEAATRNTQASRAAQELVLTTGTDEYQEQFAAYLANPEGNAQRAALSLTLANGGYLLPYVLDPTIVLTNNGSANPWRQLGRVVQTSSNSWNGVTSAGVNAAWLTEGTEAADSTPTVGPINITPAKASAWIYGSYEVLNDTDFASNIPSLISDAKDRLEESAFATGTGTSQPKGVITAATTTVTTAGVGAYAVADIYSLVGSLPARFRSSSSSAIVMNLLNINRTRQFDTAGGASFWANLGTAAPEKVLGVPLYESSTMASTITTGSKIAVYGDFSQFIIVDAVGTSVMYEPMVKGASGRATGQAGWFAYWRTGSDVATNAAFRVLVAG